MMSFALPYPPVTDQSPSVVGTMARPLTKPRESTTETPEIPCRAIPTIAVMGCFADPSAAPNARRGMFRRPSELHVALPGLTPRMGRKHVLPEADRARTSAKGWSFRSSRRPLRTRAADPSNPRAARDVLTLVHSAFVKTCPTGKGDVSLVLATLVSRETSSEPAPALTINNTPTATISRVR